MHDFKFISIILSQDAAWKSAIYTHPHYILPEYIQIPR